MPFGEKSDMSDTRIMLVGRNSFIVRHVQQAAQKRDLSVLALPHDDPLAHLLLRRRGDDDRG